MVKGRLRISGSVFRVQCLGSRFLVWDLGCGVWDSRSTVDGEGIGMDVSFGVGLKV